MWNENHATLAAQGELNKLFRRRISGITSKNLTFQWRQIKYLRIGIKLRAVCLSVKISYTWTNDR